MGSDIENAMVAYAKYGIPLNNIADIVKQEYPDASLTEFEWGAERAWQRIKKAIGNFAGWCMGAVHGDDAPEVTEVCAKIATGDLETIEFYRNQMGADDWRRCLN
jgi:hypothetical protein